MNEAVQEPVRQRDEAVRDEEPAVIYADGAKPVQWQPRGDDKAAVLLSERSAVFERPVDRAAPVDTADRVDLQPIGEVPTVWTFDLVHCRLTVTAAAMRRLPAPKVPGALRSFLGGLQPPEASIPMRALTPAETVRLDWTCDRLYAFSEIDRAVLMGVMCGYPLAMIAKICRRLIAMGIGGDRPVASKTAAHRRYRTLTETMAAEWNAAGEQIDGPTREAWITALKKQ